MLSRIAKTLSICAAAALLFASDVVVWHVLPKSFELSGAFAEVWIVNLPARALEIYRGPNFAGYGSAKTLRAGDKAPPSAFPDVNVDVAELLKTT